MRLPTRKHASFVLTALGLLLLAALLFLSDLRLLPAQTIRSTEIAYSTGETQVICRETLGPLTYHLSGNDNTLMLTSCRFSPQALTWYEQGFCVLDLTQEEGPVWAGTLRHNLREEQWSSLHLFGRVDLEGAASVRASIPGRPDLEIQLFSGPDGKSYFWAWLEGDENTFVGAKADCINLAVLDEDRTILCTYNPSRHPMRWSG